MSHSFHQMWTLLERNGPPASNPEEESGEELGALLTSGEESVALRAIRNGMNLRKEDCGSFWDDFIQVCGDADAMAELLEIPREKITGWPSKIKESLSQVEEKDNQDDGNSEKAEMVPAGSGESAADQEERGITNGPDMRQIP